MIMNAGGGGSSNPIAEVILRLVRGGDPSDAPGGGGPSGDVPEGADTRADRRDTRDTNKRTTGALSDINKKTSGYVRNTLGINLGIASILKQSQIFTGILGTIFQILGALVDVILAPFLPIIVPALKLMAENIPQIREKAEQIIGTMVKVITTIADWIGKILNFLPGSIGKVFRDIVQYWFLGLFLSRLFGFHKVYMALTKTIGAGIMFLLKSILGVNTARAAGGGGGGTFGGMGGGPYEGAYRAAGPGRLAAMRAMRPGMGAMGLGAMAVGGGIALGASQAGGKGAAYAVGGAVIGGGLGLIAGPMGAMIGASIGSIAGGALAAVIHGADDENKSNARNIDMMNANAAKAGWSYQQPLSQFAETRRTLQG